MILVLTLRNFEEEGSLGMWGPLGTVQKSMMGGRGEPVQRRDTGGGQRAVFLWHTLSLGSPWRRYESFAFERSETCVKGEGYIFWIKYQTKGDSGIALLIHLCGCGAKGHTSLRKRWKGGRWCCLLQGLATVLCPKTSVIKAVPHHQACLPFLPVIVMEPTRTPL